MLNYEFVRIMKWIDDFLISGFGIGTIISFLGLFFPLYTTLNINDSDDQAIKEQKQKVIAKRRQNSMAVTIILFILFIIAVIIKYIGLFNISDVFGVQNQYVGQTMNEKADGIGKKYTDTGYLIYKGNFRSNLYEGKGKKYDIVPINNEGQYISIIEYDGEFKHGMYDGYGKLFDTWFDNNLNTADNGMVFEEDGLKKIIKADKEIDYKPRLIYEGHFKNGQMNGEGTYYYNPDEHNGDTLTFIGYFQDGMFNGDGELYKNGELIESGKYKNNELIKEGSEQGEVDYDNSMIEETVTNDNLKNDSLGPQNRKMFTWVEPAPYPVFNSISNNPFIGDETDFVRVKEYIDGYNSPHEDNVSVVAGREYEVWIYFHNNASAGLNESGKGLAQNVRIATSYPSIIKKGDSGIIRGAVSATNTNPTTVWDKAFLNADEEVKLYFIPNSAVLHLKEDDDKNADGLVISPDVLIVSWEDVGTSTTKGALIGYYNSEDLWGVIPGCNEYAGYVTYRIKAEKY